MKMFGLFLMLLLKWRTASTEPVKNGLMAEGAPKQRNLDSHSTISPAHLRLHLFPEGQHL